MSAGEAANATSPKRKEYSKTPRRTLVGRLGLSITKTKQPKRDFVAEAGLKVVAHDKAVGNIGNLSKPLAALAYLKRPFAVHTPCASSMACPLS